jgi:hypothetical protein
MRRHLVLALAAALPLMACADMSATQQRTLSGAGIGALGGAAIGSLSGDAGMGAAIGAAAGAAGGYVWDRHKQSQEDAYAQGYEEGRSAQ